MLQLKPQRQEVLLCLLTDLDHERYCTALLVQKSLVLNSHQARNKDLMTLDCNQMHRDCVPHNVLQNLMHHVTVQEQAISYHEKQALL